MATPLKATESIARIPYVAGRMRRVENTALVDAAAENQSKIFLVDDSEESHEIKFFQDHVRNEALKFQDKIEYRLHQDIREAQASNEITPNPTAVKTCLGLVREFAPHAVLAPRLKSGVFAEESGDLSFVLQSLVTDRRLTFRISNDGEIVFAIRIDEHMKADSLPLKLCDSNALRELAEWVTTRI